MSFAPTPPPTPPAPNSKPAPVPPDHVRIEQDDVILSAGIIVGKELYAPYQPLPVGLVVPRNLVNEYRTTATSPEEYRDLRMAGDEDGLGAIQPGVPLRWNGRNWRRARQHSPEQLRAEGAASLAAEKAENEYRDQQRAEEDARWREATESARDRHNAAIELEKAQIRVNAERLIDEYEAAREHYRQESVDLGLEGLEPEPIRRPRDLTHAYAKAKPPATKPAPAQAQAATAEPRDGGKKPAPKQPSKPAKPGTKKKGK